MSVWPHAAFSQRATWPPSATVRQCSIALITFSWSRLTWPRLASRQAGPRLRRMSATSRATALCEQPHDRLRPPIGDYGPDSIIAQVSCNENRIRPRHIVDFDDLRDVAACAARHWRVAQMMQVLDKIQR